MPKKIVGRGYCEECGEWVYAALVDNGIGPYEYWGARGVHHDYDFVCEVCENSVTDFEEDEDDR